MNNKAKRMKSFLDWMKDRVQSRHKITNKEFVNILDKM